MSKHGLGGLALLLRGHRHTGDQGRRGRVVLRQVGQRVLEVGHQVRPRGARADGDERCSSDEPAQVVAPQLARWPGTGTRKARSGPASDGSARGQWSLGLAAGPGGRPVLAET